MNPAPLCGQGCTAAASAYLNDTDCARCPHLQARGNPRCLCCRFKLQYTVDRPPEVWPHCQGFINEEMCRNNLFEHAPGTITLLCGPPPMLQYACHPNLDKMGFEKGVSSFEF